MPPMAATPVAIPQGTEPDLDQEFELDIRISTAKTSLPVLCIVSAVQRSCPVTDTCATDCGSCASCGGTCGCPDTWCQCSQSECGRSYCTTFHTCPC